jgi:hypothetical protein
MAARAKFYPAQLSCGQQKRVAMLMFFIMTSSLFFKPKEDVFKNLYTLCRPFALRGFVCVFAYLRDTTVNQHRRFTAKIGAIVKAN